MGGGPCRYSGSGAVPIIQAVRVGGAERVMLAHRVSSSQKMEHTATGITRAAHLVGRTADQTGRR